MLAWFGNLCVHVQSVFGFLLWWACLPLIADMLCLHQLVNLWCLSGLVLDLALLARGVLGCCTWDFLYKVVK